ncbi:MAG: 50S ribosomal protein L24 [Candidatus Liptonbacteria bacterium RIFCSPHIGHO2_01_FULL_57_28]|uniref:Large ribosomal subunit protein uL24 n=1 Tax=Candidatus Liptonbacteria bacterium RIFCSPHIGHO2_01_FULL_57_28 TaxID=1798647 RepID=A0A1G2CBT6_9BACT|nr:MAG: 50S ribosomal protein L24 [Candidatus Liptonbacteria bacterium RIFCSPHIGHO2_01_FULL_57_28]
MKFKKGDQVQIMLGKDRGKTGTINAVLKDKDRVVVENLNMYKKRTRPKRQGQKGETLMVARAIPAANVMYICKNCKRPTRLGARVEGDQKVRYCKKCDAAA